MEARWRTNLVLLAMAIAAWLPALGAGFHYDDFANVVHEAATTDPAALADRLANGFRPLLRLSYAADYTLWGMTATGFLATNLLLHAATVLGVAALARTRLAGEWAVLLAASIFALQPTNAAAVAWTSGRSTLLATALMVAAIVAHERGNCATRWRVASLLMMLLAVLAKETALVLPLLLVLWEFTRPEQVPAREIARRVLPAAICAALAAAVALGASSRLREIVAFSLALSAPSDALAVNAMALPLSLSLWWRPWALSIEQPFDYTAAGATAGAAALLGLIVAAAIAQRSRRMLVTLALVWPVVALLPTHSVLARLDPITEKALYPAWIGPSLALGAAAAWAVSRVPAKGWRTAAAAALMLGLGALCTWRASVWADPAVLWREATMRNPDSARAWSNRALAELAAGQGVWAERSVAQARRLSPEDERVNDATLAVSLALPPTKEPQP